MVVGKQVSMRVWGVFSMVAKVNSQFGQIRKCCNIHYDIQRLKSRVNKVTWTDNVFHRRPLFGVLCKNGLYIYLNLYGQKYNRYVSIQ